MRWLVGVFLLSGVACRPAPRPEAAPAGPVIERLVPDSGPAGRDYPLRVAIEGAGFAQRGNMVRFGDIAVTQLEAESPTRIEFLVPKERPSTGEVPPMALLPGRYRVTVRTPAGGSDSTVFTLTGGS